MADNLTGAHVQTIIRAAIKAELSAALPKALAHIADARTEAAKLPDRSSDRAGHDKCVCAMHAHCKAADRYLDEDPLLSGDHDRLKTSAPASASLPTALDCIRNASEEADTLPDPDADAARHAERLQSVHGQVQMADKCLDRYRSALVDDSDDNDMATTDPEIRAIRQRARAAAAVLARGLH